MNKINKYFAKNPWYNAIVHLIGGMGIGILITHPIVDPHPLRWGLTFISLSFLGHLWAIKK